MLAYFTGNTVFDGASDDPIAGETTFPMKRAVWLGEHSPIWLGELYSRIDNKTCCFVSVRIVGFSDRMPSPPNDRT